MLDGNAIDELAASLRGRLVLPEDADYDEIRSVWNGMIDRRPALVARCAGTADVMRAVGFARHHGLPVSVRGGGHNVAGKAVCEDGLMIDLSDMNSVRIDPADRTARVGPGARWGDFDHEAQAFGLATTGGVDSRTGVAGLTVGGGIGWLARSYGLSLDNLLGADVVTSSGELVHASEDENPDLFWGLRGGGGSLGVVTSFRFRLHEVGPEVQVAQVFHPFEAAGDLFRFYRDFMRDAPDEVACYGFILHVPPAEPFPEAYHGKATAALVACYNGDLEEGREMLRPLVEFGEPMVAAVDPMPYTTLQQNFNDGYPNGARYYGKSAFIEELSDDLVDDLVSFADPLLGPMTAIFFESMGGAVARVEPDATAFPNRGAPFNLSALCGWEDPARDDEMVGWAREFDDTIRPYSTGGVYANYLDQDDQGRVRAAYGPNYDRLQKVKRQWDPEDLFRMT